MNVVWLSVLAAAVLYGLHNVFSKAAAGARSAAGAGIADVHGALVVEVAAVLSIAVYFLLFARAGSWNAAPRAYVWSAVAGLCAGLGTIAYFAIFTRGGELSTAGPIVLLGGVAIMSIAGIMVFGEPLTVKKALGLALGAAGIYLLKSAG